MEWVPVAAAVAGGVVGIAGSLAATLLAARHAERTRWDEERERAVGEVVEIAARLEGLHYRRGQSEAKGESLDRRQNRQDRCEEGLDQLYAKAARLRAVVPELTEPLERVFDSERTLRHIADRGLRDRTDEWTAARADHRRAVDTVGRGAAEVLGTGRG